MNDTPRIFLGTPQQPTKGQRYDVDDYIDADELLTARSKKYKVNIDQEERIIADTENFGFKVDENEDIDALIAFADLDDHEKVATAWRIYNENANIADIVDDDNPQADYFGTIRNDNVHDQRYSDFGYLDKADETGLHMFITNADIVREFEAIYIEFEYNGNTYRFAQ